MDRQRQHDKQRPGSRGEYLFAVGFSLATVAAGLLLITGVSTVFPAPLGWVLLMIGGGWLLLLVVVVPLHKCWLSLKKSATSQQQPRGTNMIHLDRVRSSRRSPDEEGK